MRHPVGCGQKPAPDETEKWEHWRVIAGVSQFHCMWDLVQIKNLDYKCEWNLEDGLFHKRCLRREGFIW